MCASPFRIQGEETFFNKFVLFHRIPRPSKKYTAKLVWIEFHIGPQGRGEFFEWVNGEDLFGSIWDAIDCPISC
jgi:hypothetical protein